MQHNGHTGSPRPYVSSSTGRQRNVSCLRSLFCSLSVALALWSLSLHSVDIRQMNDLGLVSVLPASIVIALFLLNVSFCVTMGQERVRVPVAFLHLALLIFMLYSVTTLVEEAVRFATVYTHAGYTEYIMRTGSVDPSLDAYFSWPGFFVLSAFVTQAAGYHSILAVCSMGAGFPQRSVSGAAVYDLHNHHLRETPGVGVTLALLLDQLGGAGLLFAAGPGLLFLPDHHRGPAQMVSGANVAWATVLDALVTLSRASGTCFAEAR